VPLQSPPPPSRRELRADQGTWFCDTEGRRLLLRGVNLTGSSKFPVHQATHMTDGFYDTSDVSFVDRPFPLAEADEHFARLRAWGLTFVRLLVPWEAVEHKGPGVYDEAYLDYLLAIVRKAKAHDIACFVDPHQDVWSRWTGGDGAPAWTLDRVGFDIRTLHASGAAFSHQGHILETHGCVPLPQMTWASNHHRLACGTMFTLFFAGRDFAPGLEIDGQNVQDFLQGHYIAAMARVAQTLAAEDNVVGFDSLNEPNLGMVGWHDLRRGSRFLRQGPSPTWFESFQLGEGYATSVAYYNPTLVPAGTRTLNKRRVRAWKDGHGCVWKRHGVWDDASGVPVLLAADYFKYRLLDGRRVRVRPESDYFVPFVLRFKTAIDAAVRGAGQPRLLVFVDRNTSTEDASVGQYPRGAHLPVHACCVCCRRSLRVRRADTVLCTDPAACEGLVWAPHWYDVVTLVFKSCRSWLGVAREHKSGLPIVLGNANVVREYARQLRLLRDGGAALAAGRGVPTIVGELGIPFDLGGAAAYRSGDFRLQISAMDTTLQALDMALLSATLWNYTPDNTNAHGDGWNGEDLSIFSRDQIAPGREHDLFAGGRALQAVVRPYAVRCAGTPLRMSFDLATRTFRFEFEHDPGVAGAPTVIFVPLFQYPQPPRITVSDGTTRFAMLAQTLEYRHDPACGRVHALTIAPASLAA